MVLLGRLLKRHHVLLLFLILELAALRMHYGGRSYAASRLYIGLRSHVSKFYEFRSEVLAYLSLREISDQLLAENLALRTQISGFSPQVEPFDPLLHVPDSQQHRWIRAYVIQNSHRYAHNTLTLDKGALDGLQPGMGIVAQEGIVGRICYVSDHFATAYSLLDVDLLTSAQLGKDGILCSVNWAAKGTQEAKVSYLPRHAQPALGDTVYTSGYGGIYLPNLPIGIVTDAKLGASDSFYHVLIRVLTDFYALHYVYVLKWPLQQEYDSLQFRMDLANKP